MTLKINNTIKTQFFLIILIIFQMTLVHGESTNSSTCRAKESVNKSINPLITINFYHKPSLQQSKKLLDICVAQQLRLKKCGMSSRGNPMGETVFMRTDYSLDIPPEVKRTLAAANLTNNYLHAHKLLSKLLNSENADYKWVASLSAAYIAFKDPNIDKGSSTIHKVLEELYVSSKKKPKRLSDYWFLKAVNDSYQGHYESAIAAINNATKIEPEFYAAQVLSASFLLNSTRAWKTNLHLCKNHIRKIFLVANSIANINPCPLNLSHLDRYFKVKLKQNYKEYDSIVMTYYLAWISKNEMVMKELMQQLLDQNSIPSKCKTEIINILDKLK